MRMRRKNFAVGSTPMLSKCVVPCTLCATLGYSASSFIHSVVCTPSQVLCLLRAFVREHRNGSRKRFRHYDSRANSIRRAAKYVALAGSASALASSGACMSNKMFMLYHYCSMHWIKLDEDTSRYTRKYTSIVRFVYDFTHSLCSILFRSIAAFM